MFIAPQLSRIRQNISIIQQKDQQKWTNRIHLARCSFIIALVESRTSLICCIIRDEKVIRARVRRIVNARLLGNACQAHLP